MHIASACSYILWLYTHVRSIAGMKYTLCATDKRHVSKIWEIFARLVAYNGIAMHISDRQLANYFQPL